MEVHLLNLALVFIAAVAGGALARKLGYPGILGELIVGIALGPAALGLLQADEALQVFGTLGVLLLMLYVGMHLDIGDLRRSSGPALLAAVGGFVVPAAAGYWLMTAFGASARAALFVAVAMGVTSLATKSRILVDLRILDTRVAHVMMTGALVADFVALVAFSALLGAGDHGAASVAGLAIVAVKAVLFTAACFVVGTRLFPLGVAWLSRGGGADRGSVFLIVVAVALIFGAAAEAAGLHGLLGTFFAGLLLRPGLLAPRLFRDVERLVYRVSVGFLAPIFFISAGFQVDLGVVRTDLPLLVGVILVAMVGKVAGTALFYLPSGLGWREGVTVGAGMNGRGAVEVIVAEIALAGGLIDQTTFSVLVLMALITTAAVPFLLTWCVAWLRARGELVRFNRRSGTIVIGANPTARCLAAVFAAHGPTTLIDTNLNQCAEAQRAGLQAIHGNALDLSILRQADAADVERIVCLTANSSLNVLVAERALAEFGVPIASVLLTDVDAASLLESLHNDQIRPVLRAPFDLERWNKRIAGGVAELAPIPGPVPGFPPVLGEAAESESAVPLLLRRNGQVMLVSEVTASEDGDEVIGLVGRAFGSAAATAPKIASPPTLAGKGHGL